MKENTNEKTGDEHGKLDSLVRSELLDCLELFELEKGWVRVAENDVDRGLLNLGIKLGFVNDVSPQRGTYYETFFLTPKGRMFKSKSNNSHQPDRACDG